MLARIVDNAPVLIKIFFASTTRMNTGVLKKLSIILLISVDNIRKRCTFEMSEHDNAH